MNIILLAIALFLITYVMIGELSLNINMFFGRWMGAIRDVNITYSLNFNDLSIFISLFLTVIYFILIELIGM